MKLVVFLGAGVSIASNLPTALELTRRIFEPIVGEDASTSRTRALLALIRDYDTADIGRPGPLPGGGSSGAIFRGKESTYEDLFFLCQELSLWAIGQSDNSLTTPFMEVLEQRAGGLLLETTPQARMRELALAGRAGCELIEAVAAHALDRRYITGLDRLVDLARSTDIDELNIVTLNHDTLVEQHLTGQGIGFADGFGPPDGDVRWSDDGAYDDPACKVRIFKLHGSVNWYQFAKADRMRTAILLGGDPMAARDSSGRPLEVNPPRPRFLSGLSKAISYNTGIYADIHYRFWGLLRRCGRMLMCGYGWGDTAISLQLEGWLDRSTDHRLVLLHPNFGELVDHSLTIASSQRGWLASGRLVVVPQWLSDVSMADVLSAFG